MCKKSRTISFCFFFTKTTETYLSNKNGIRFFNVCAHYVYTLFRSLKNNIIGVILHHLEITALGVRGDNGRDKTDRGQIQPASGHFLFRRFGPFWSSQSLKITPTRLAHPKRRTVSGLFNALYLCATMPPFPGRH